jgi:hypothetical protein
MSGSAAVAFWYGTGQVACHICRLETTRKGLAPGPLVPTQARGLHPPRCIAELSPRPSLAAVPYMTLHSKRSVPPFRPRPAAAHCHTRRADPVGPDSTRYADGTSPELMAIMQSPKVALAPI